MTARRQARKPAPRPAADAARTRTANAASRKAASSPGKLTEAELSTLPGHAVLALGNAGKIKHLGIGTGKSGAKLGSNAAQRGRGGRTAGR
jgi:hypothetical protein